MKNELILLSILIIIYLMNFSLLYFLLLSLSSIAYYIVIEMRYSLVYFPLFIIGFIQGRNVKIITDTKEIKRLMKYTDKGRGIEELFSTPAWNPILSIESVNGPLWETLRDNFISFANYIPHEDKLSQIANTEAIKLKQSNAIIDGELISKTTIKIFFFYLFCENHLPLDMPKNDRLKEPIQLSFIESLIDNEFLDISYKANLNWRKVIAVKGEIEMEIRLRCINIIIDILKKSKYASIWDWDKDVHFSVVLQPFSMSPMINMSDIAVAIKLEKEELNLFKEGKYQSFLEYMDIIIAKNHPFPLLERFEESTNTQYYIDLINNKVLSGILNFGMGPRMCLGRVYGRIFLEYFFKDIYDLPNFKPEVNHLHSGRDNDNDFSLSIAFYQFKLLLKLFYQEYKLRKAK